MTEPNAASSQSVFCVAVTVSDLPASIAAELHHVQVNTCPDVYRALARIGRGSPTVVIVCADWLSASEIEFFQVLRRSKPALPVLIFGSPRAESRIEAALQAGATGLLNQERLRGSFRLEGIPLAKRPDPTPPTIAPLSGKTLESSNPLASPGNELDGELYARLNRSIEQANASATKPAADNFDSQDTGQFDHDADVPDELDENDDPASEYDRLDQPPEDSAAPSDADGDDDDFVESEGSETRPIRVPWLRYDNGPKRVAPQRKRPSPPEPPPGAQGERMRPLDHDDPPLLSQEELEALLGESGNDELA